MNLKTRFFAIAGSVALVTGAAAIGAPPASATPALVGSCRGATLLGKFTPAETDTTQHETLKVTTIKVGLSVLGGTCDGLIDEPLDPSGAGQPPATMTVKSETMSLVGSTSCSATADPGPPRTDPGDPNAALAYPLYGKLSITMLALNGLGKPWTLQAYVSGLSETGDVVHIGGEVVKGADPGAIVGGHLWEDPVVKGPYAQGGGYNTSVYQLNVLAESLCYDGVPADVTPGIAAVLIGGGTSPESGGLNKWDTSESPVYEFFQGQGVDPSGISSLVTDGITFSLGE